MRYVLRPSAALGLVSLLALGACGAGQTDPVDTEPDVTTMVLHFDQDVPFRATASGFQTQLFNIDEPGFTIQTADFLRLNGEPETMITIENFRLNVAGDSDGGPLPTGVVFTRSGPFAGTVSGIGPGQSVLVYFSLHHVLPNHEDFGPFALTVVRAGGGGGGEP